jgi:hypothetical protein
MSNLRAAAQQALEALETDAVPLNAINNAAALLRAALAQPEQEPVAVPLFRNMYSVVWYEGYADDADGGGPYEERVLYTTPPRREWVSLTDEEIKALLPGAVRVPPGWRETVAAVEAKLKEKNT